ncbi:hypothetical protein AWC38_SpisGene1376 [Stylophora pistillata]|uniref:Uncharacterized protein n=1 Tax=Stylophora pistillata TaxID=50429 RepID=A0A2B4SZ12_STYPI|nr:hypothetical protein AWC38_SpisGene1376 [Stylophora pistillata]
MSKAASGCHQQIQPIKIALYITIITLKKYGTKKAKLEAIRESIIQELAKRIEREEDGKSNNQSSSDSLSSESEDDSEEKDCVLAEIGISSSEEEEESTEEEEMIESTENFNVNIRQLSTHGLGKEQLKSKFKINHIPSPTPPTGDAYVQCHHYNDWWHLKCVDIPPWAVESNKSW